MYSDKDLLDIDRQFRRRLWLLMMIEGVLAAGMAYSLAVRLQWLTVLLSCVMGSAAIIYAGMTLAPLHAYRKYLRALLPGHKRELSGIFKGFDAHSILRDNVSYLSFLLNVGDPDDSKDDRQLYYDTNLPLPDWREGERLWIASFDKSVTGWRRETI